MINCNAISITQDLIRFNTVNPPGNEAKAAQYLAEILVGNGFDVALPAFGENRLQLVAEKGLCKNIPPVVLSGHLDVVPPGNKPWTVDPFGGEIIEGKLFGRGSSDMKGGVAALLCAAIKAFQIGEPKGGVRFIITASEETGCQGIRHLISTHANLGNVRGIIVAEPTQNKPAIGHKGGLYLKVTVKGKTAHSSMPHLGDNAIYKAARAISKIEAFDFGAEKDALLGLPTINVGKFSGGQNLNSVPDHARFTIDIRSTTKIAHAEILERIQKELTEGLSVETLVDLKPVSTTENEPFVQGVYKACSIDPADDGYPISLPYLTDGSVLQAFYNGAPTIILGPGLPEMAHQTDEFCPVKDIEKAVEIYTNILLNNK